MGVVEGVRAKGVEACERSTNSKFEMLDGDLVLAALGGPEIQVGIAARLFVGSASSCGFFVKRPELSLTYPGFFVVLAAIVVMLLSCLSCQSLSLMGRYVLVFLMLRALLSP